MAKPIPPEEVDRRFVGRGFMYGWTIRVVLAGAVQQIDLLLGRAFPHERVRVAVDPASFLTWPHVESDGLVCLPAYAFDADDPLGNVNDALLKTIEFISSCASDVWRAAEFQKEFVSYWGHVATSDRLLLTLFQPEGVARPLRSWTGQRYVVLSDQKARLRQWLSQSGETKDDDFEFGLYLPTQEPPAPPYPPDAESLIEWCRSKGTVSSIDALKDPLAKGPRFHLVIGADVDGRRGLVGATITKAPNLSHRATRQNRKIDLSLLAKTGTLSFARVERGYPAWVHGRDQSLSQPVLEAAKVMIIGCGALGSHVAVRLAQSGVGAFVLVDPERLVAANVGRHVLGMTAVGLNKAVALKQYLRFRFPHVTSIDALAARWQDLRWDQTHRVSTLLCMIGESGPELFLNKQHLEKGATPPVVYGWMEERAAAAHALAIVKPTNCLRCVLNGDGSTKSPETKWEGGGALLSEPACGAVFQPFGPVELARAEAVVSGLALDVILGKVTDNSHRVYSIATQRLLELGGAWTEEHALMRPAGWGGAIEFDRPLDSTTCEANLH